MNEDIELLTFQLEKCHQAILDSVEFNLARIKRLLIGREVCVNGKVYQVSNAFFRERQLMVEAQGLDTLIRANHLTFIK